MTLYDVSVPISANTPTYPGDPGVEITSWLRLADGDPANVSFIRFGAHTGTHVDAPAHFLVDGNPVKTLPLDILIGAAVVFEVPDRFLVIDENIVEEACSSGATRVLFKTRNSSFWNESEPIFHPDYTYISPNAARALVSHGVRLVGIDYLSVEQFKSEDFATHHVLLGGSVVVVEGLDLRQVQAGSYEFICLPLKISDGAGDGAPARAVLRSID